MHPTAADTRLQWKALVFRGATPMSADFESIHNYHEHAVFDAVMAGLKDHPHLQGSELLADIACVALNRLPPRYIRHPVDFSFYLSEKERAEIEKQIAESVAFAFQFVQARAAMRART